MTTFDFESLCVALGEQFRRQQACLVTVESCTGGGVAHAVTAIAGSSDWFDSALVTYSNQAKQDLAGVPAELIARYGAVSTEVAVAMASGAVTRCQSGARQLWGVATTGVAGPGGGSVDKPVGTVCFAWVLRQGNDISLCTSERKQFNGDRTEIRNQSIDFALQTLLGLLPRYPPVVRSGAAV